MIKTCSQFVIAFLVLSTFSACTTLSAESCTGLFPFGDNNIHIKESGNYCLYKSTSYGKNNPPWYGAGHGRGSVPSGTALIKSSNVNFDLKNHSLDGGPSTQGVYFSKDKPDYSNIKIHNGSMRVLGPAVNAGFDYANMYSDTDNGAAYVKEGKDNPKRWIYKADYQSAVLKERPATPAAYPARNITIDNLRIYSTLMGMTNHAERGGINIQGANTVIQNSTIEVEAGTAIWIFGPNARIENNTIIVHGMGNRLREADAPIRLTQADGAIIRNNTIIIKGKANKRAISVFDTGEFLFEGNTLQGMSESDPVATAYFGELTMKASGTKYAP